jgi:hypothetical protein
VSAVDGVSVPHPALARWLAVISLTVITTGIAANFRHPYLMDYLSYWAAAKLAIGGHASSAYDVMLHHEVQERVLAFDTRLPFTYPPPYLLLLLPFGLLSYWSSSVVWIGFTLSAYVAVARRVMPQFVTAAIAFPPVAICGVIGQNGVLTASLFIGGLFTLGARPFVAGLILGCLAMKPQLGVLLPLAFVAGRENKAFAGATLAVIALVLLSIFAFGLDPWRGFFATTALSSSIAIQGLTGWHKMATVFASLRFAGVAEPIAWILHGACGALGSILVWRIWRETRDPLARAAILAPATVLISPYLYVYDQVMLVISFFWLAQNGANRWLLFGLFLLPLATIGQFWLSNPQINPAPVLPLALLLLVRFHFVRNSLMSGATNPLRASTEKSLSRE